MSIKKIEGTLVFVQLQKPIKAYVKAGAPAKPDEWKASVVVTDKDVIKEYKKFGKSLDTLVSVKDVDSDDFEETYKCPLPEGAGDEVWVVTLRKSTELGKTGKPVPDQFKPRVFEKVGKTLVDITASKLVGNGSKGAISIDVFNKQDGSGAIYLKNVLVTELVEFESPEYAEAGSEFDDDGEAPAKTEAAPEPKKPAAKPKVKAKVEEDDDDQIPF